MPSTRFNIFQKLVRQWDTLHPYNAAQAIRLAGMPDIQLLRAAWHETLDVLGLGRVRVNCQSFSHESLNGDSLDHTVAILPAGTCFEQYITDELNRPFGWPDCYPFRPFVIVEGESHFIGVVYQHWVADSASIRLLLREWFVRVYDRRAARQRPVRMPDGGYWHFFRPDKARWGLAEGFLSSVRWSSRFKRVRRVESTTCDDFAVRFTMHQVPVGIIDDCLAFARSHQATVNDVFLAAIAEACDRLVPARPSHRRPDLALGSIVDLRPYVQRDLNDVFGMFLGFTSVICRPNDLADWDRLVRAIAVQSAIHKRTGVPQASIVRMLAGLIAGRFLKPKNVPTFYRKRVPLTGGISNINMNTQWPAQYHPNPLMEYIRISPTGPMMPLVFTTTTLGKTLNFGLTCRESIVTPDRTEAISHAFVNRLKRLTSNPRPGVPASAGHENPVPR